MTKFMAFMQASIFSALAEELRAMGFRARDLVVLWWMKRSTIDFTYHPTHSDIILVNDMVPILSTKARACYCGPPGLWCDPWLTLATGAGANLQQ